MREKDATIQTIEWLQQEAGSSLHRSEHYSNDATHSLATANDITTKVYANDSINPSTHHRGVLSNARRKWLWAIHRVLFGIHVDKCISEIWKW
jgi:hypothetical protein